MMTQGMIRLSFFRMCSSWGSLLNCWLRLPLLFSLCTSCWDSPVSQVWEKPTRVPSLPLNHGTMAVLLVLWGGFFDPFSILLAGVASLKGLWLLAEVGKQAGRKRCFPEQEGEAHWHSTSGLSFSWCWRRIRDTIFRKSKLKCKCDVWRGQHNIWTWTQSWALFSVCPHILS